MTPSPDEILRPWRISFVSPNRFGGVDRETHLVAPMTRSGAEAWARVYAKPWQESVIEPAPLEEKP